MLSCEPIPAVIDDHDLAARVATDAGHLLLAVRQDPAREGALLRDEGDRRSHDHIVTALATWRPDDAVLSEEAPDDPVRLGANRVWIVDPLDGTREFAERERADWAVHVALVAAGELVAGAVALPALGVTLVTSPPPMPPPPRQGPIRLAVSRTRPPQLAEKLRSLLDGELVPMGSAGAKAMAVVRGDADVYAHAGGQYEWDSAAPVAVASATGLHVSRLDGSPLRYNQPNPWLPDLLICRPELADQVLGAISSVS